MRQSKSQRAVLTNYILVIVAAVSGLQVQQQLKPITLPLSSSPSSAGTGRSWPPNTRTVYGASENENENGSGPSRLRFQDAYENIV